MKTIISVLALTGIVILAASGCSSSNTDSQNLSTDASAASSEDPAASDLATTTTQLSDSPTSEDPLDSDASRSTCNQELPSIENSPRESAKSALSDRFWDGFSPLVDPSRIISGGVSPDGIPPIDSPNFLCPDEVDFLSDTEPVLSLTIGSDARAYPVQIMTWHEIVNDVVDGIPVTVTYCPLCNSAVSHGRQLGERVLDFGTSGFLYNSSLVMYDRQTETLWTHFEGRAVIGELEGAELEYFPVSIVPWGEWKKANPDGRVLDRVYIENGYPLRSYGQNPYVDYLRNERILDPNVGADQTDERLSPKTLVIGIRTESTATALVREEISAKGAVDFQFDNLDLTAWYLPGTNSALDTRNIASGLDIGSIAVFERGVDICELAQDVRGICDPLSCDSVDCGITILEFELAEGEIRDKLTGSTWNIFGKAVSGDLTGLGLKPREFLDTFWFAWSGFNPDTSIEGR